MKKQSEQEKKLAQEVQADFEKRRDERRAFEAAWQLNTNFLMGNQFCVVGAMGDIEDTSKKFSWTQQEVFNHITPTIEMRLAKLSRVRPAMTVLPASNDDNDVYAAKVSRSIIKSLSQKLRLNEMIQEATKWSELCGTAFYKVIWNGNTGKMLAQTEDGKALCEGDVEIAVIPPYEIFPGSLTCENMEDQNSLIHARAYATEDIKSLWGREVEGSEIDVYALGATSSGGGLGYNSTIRTACKTTRDNHAIVIERYQMPNSMHPNGRLTIVCQNQVFFDGALPYVNGTDGKRGLPFIKQASLTVPGSFFGMSVIERCIPLQRAYNAVKNRKHEFLNRLSMGVLTVEDGSVDIDNLEEEGLPPGKVLTYRQGSRAPGILYAGNVPIDFAHEEERLLNEFMLISGVSDLMRSSKIFSSNASSGIALQLLIEQDDSRIAPTAEQIKFAAKEIAKHAIRLYKQFAYAPRLARIVNSNSDVESFYFSGSDINACDVVFETENELSESLAQKRGMVFDLLKTGVLLDETGKLDNRARRKVLEMLGFGTWESGQDLAGLHLKRADEENLSIKQNQKAEVLEVDDHTLHLQQHTAYAICGELKENRKAMDALMQHIQTHKFAVQKTKGE